MQIRYDAEADVLLVQVRDVPPTDAVEEPGGVNESLISNFGLRIADF